MLLLLTLRLLQVSPVLAQAPQGVVPAQAIPQRAVPGFQRGALDRAVDAAAAEFGVPAPILLALGWEASHWNADVETRWGGYGLFDLREGDQDPSLEHAGALLEVDPNRIITDWRLQVRGAAAILADQARLSNGGVLPPAGDLLAWWDAVRAFSGREEPVLQDQYARYIFETLNEGATRDTVWGPITIQPEILDLTGLVADPPPTPCDSSLAYQYYAACADNYSDYSRTAADIDMVVIHLAEGSYSGTYAWFANCSAEASSQYVVRSSDGQITQMVKEEDVAWHAGNWDYNLRSIGIEHEGYVSDCSYFTDAMYAGSAALVVDIANRQGVPLDRSHIIGHDEVPDPDGSGYGGSGHHTDPGSCWDWDYYMSLLDGSTSTSGGEIIGAVRDSDIYNGANLVGANVWIAETGEATTVAGDGYYRFEDVPFGTYTMHATYPGYAEGTCTKTTTSSQDWCSIALFPGTSPDDTGGNTDTSGGTDTSDPGDTAPPDGDSATRFPGPPGDPVLAGEAGSGCGCATAPGGSLAGVALGAVMAGLARRRRR